MLESEVYQAQAGGIIYFIFDSLPKHFFNFWEHGFKYQLLSISIICLFLYSVLATVWALGMTNMRTCIICRKNIKKDKK